jgi:hypothetical protein
VWDVVFHHGESLGSTGVYKITISQETPYDEEMRIFRKLKLAFIKTFYSHMMTSFELQDQVAEITQIALAQPMDVRGIRDPYRKEYLQHNSQHYLELRTQLTTLEHQNSLYLCRIDDVGEQHYNETFWDQKMAEVC